MLGLPNPWVLLGAVLAVIGAAIGGFFYGQHVENLSWQAAAAQQKAQAAQMLADKTQEADAANQANAKLSLQLDEVHDASLTEIETARADNQHLRDQLDALGRMRRQPGRGHGSGNPMPRAAAVASPAANAAAPAGQSGADQDIVGILAQSLVDTAHAADVNAEYADVCHAWAVKIGQVQ